jgi:hypothetical protein
MTVAHMSFFTRFGWVLPCMVAACGSSSVNGDLSGDGGNHRSTGGEGGRTVVEDGGLASGGAHPTRGTGGRANGTGGFFGSDGGFFGGDGGFFGGDGGFFGGDGGFSGTGTFFGRGGTFFGSGGFFAAGGFFGSGGSPEAGGAAGSPVLGAGGHLVDPACCEAIPFCRAGYDQVSGPGECVKGDICYEATACCSTIWCKAHPDQDAGACAAEAPPSVHYISANASVCDRRAWTCPTNAYPYWDTCGCGCSQDSACPASIDCTKVPNDPICTDETTCPYTHRVR